MTDTLHRASDVDGAEPVVDNGAGAATGAAGSTETPPPGPTPAAAEPSSSLLTATPAQVLKVLGSVVAPLSVITGLMYYFGVAHAYWFFRRFGVDYTVFQLTTEDYLYRSADGLFVPLTVLAAVGLVLLWTSRLLPPPSAEQRTTVARFAVPVTAGAGAVLALVAVVGVLRPELLYRWVALPGLSLTAGAIALFAASRLQTAGSRRASRHPSPPTAAAEWLAVFVLVTVGLFWAAGDYSAAVGTRRGDQVLQALPQWPDAVVYSERSLNVDLPGVRESPCAEPDAAHAFRYDGLKLILHAGGQYLFLPEGWSPGTGTALVIPDSGALRLEFTDPGVSRSGGC